MGKKKFDKQFLTDVALCWVYQVIKAGRAYLATKMIATDTPMLFIISFGDLKALFDEVYERADEAVVYSFDLPDAEEVGDEAFCEALTDLAQDWVNDHAAYAEHRKAGPKLAKLLPTLWGEVPALAGVRKEYEQACRAGVVELGYVRMMVAAEWMQRLEKRPAGPKYHFSIERGVPDEPPTIFSPERVKAPVVTTAEQPEGAVSLAEAVPWV